MIPMLCCLFLGITMSFGQITLSGKILDQTNGDPLIGANIYDLNELRKSGNHHKLGSMSNDSGSWKPNFTYKLFPN